MRLTEKQQEINELITLWSRLYHAYKLFEDNRFDGVKKFFQPLSKLMDDVDHAKSKLYIEAREENEKSS